MKSAWNGAAPLTNRRRRRRRRRRAILRLAGGALGSRCSGRGIRVAPSDTGIDLRHPAIPPLLSKGKIVLRNFINGAPDDVTDSHGHGTHCAGAIAASNVNSQRIGIAPNLVVPGIDIVSAGFNDGLTSMSETSMAIPHTAGVAALWAEWITAVSGQPDFQDLLVELLGSVSRLDARRTHVVRAMLRAPS